MDGTSRGVERLIERIGGRRVGLVTGPSGWLGRPGHLIDILHGRGVLRALFAPEHGVWGDLQAGEKVPGGRDRRTGLPVHSLYGETREPTAEMLAGLDLLVGCLQDSGSRPYTFQTTLAGCLRACARVGKPLVVLDRPTPLGAVVSQGNVAGGTFFPVPLPMRPGLTIGEMLRLLVHDTRLDVELEVVPLLEAPRDCWFDELPLPWVAPSPNLPTLESAICFGATVLLEATNVSEGRGTTRPFELIGAPWCDGHRLAEALNRRRIPGLLARAAAFVPTFSKHVGKVCRGVQIHVLERASFDTPAVGIHILHALRSLHAAEFKIDSRALDVRFDSKRERTLLEAGGTPEEVMAGWPEELEAFRERAGAAGVGPEGRAA